MRLTRIAALLGLAFALCAGAGSGRAARGYLSASVCRTAICGWPVGLDVPSPRRFTTLPVLRDRRLDRDAHLAQKLHSGLVAGLERPLREVDQSVEDDRQVGGPVSARASGPWRPAPAALSAPPPQEGQALRRRIRRAAARGSGSACRPRWTADPRRTGCRRAGPSAAPWPWRAAAGSSRASAPLRDPDLRWHGSSTSSGTANILSRLDVSAWKHRSEQRSSPAPRAASGPRRCARSRPRA